MNSPPNAERRPRAESGDQQKHDDDELSVGPGTDNVGMLARIARARTAAIDKQRAGRGRRVTG